MTNNKKQIEFITRGIVLTPTPSGQTEVSFVIEEAQTEDFFDLMRRGNKLKIIIQSHEQKREPDFMHQL